MRPSPFSRRAQLASLLFGMTALVISAALAQELGGTDGTFDLSWSTIDGGGGTSTGGAFEVSGTIGQPDSGVVMSGGDYELRGGFWAGGIEPVPTCPADLAPGGGDGLVSTPDLLFIINAWGPCPIPPTACAADIAPPGGNGSVGTPDLLAIINAWGVCP